MKRDELDPHSVDVSVARLACLLDRLLARSPARPFGSLPCSTGWMGDCCRRLGRRERERKMEGGAAAAAVDWLGCKGKPAAPPGTRLRSVSPPPFPPPSTSGFCCARRAYACGRGRGGTAGQGRAAGRLAELGARHGGRRRGWRWIRVHAGLGRRGVGKGAVGEVPEAEGRGGSWRGGKGRTPGQWRQPQVVLERCLCRAHSVV